MHIKRPKPKKSSNLKNGRYAQVDAMLSELLAETDPEGCAVLLDDLRARYQPVCPEEDALVQSLAMLLWRACGCPALEARILRTDLLSTLASYEEMLNEGSDACMQQLNHRLTQHYRQTESTASLLGKGLEKLEPCTSVIQ